MCLPNVYNILSYSIMLFAGTAADAKVGVEDVKDLAQRVTEMCPGIDWDVPGSTFKIEHQNFSSFWNGQT